MATVAGEAAERGSGGTFSWNGYPGGLQFDVWLMVHVKDRGDLNVHQEARSEREQFAIGKANRDVRVRPARGP